MAMREGDVLGAYRIVRLVGRGGMGAVYLADDLRLGRQVALKVLGSDTADIPTVRERFVRESRLAASLDHPNILPIYEAGEADGQLFIAMRYVPGRDLERAISGEGPLSVDRTVDLIDQVASGLDAAHAAGLIHRDVKPGNILLAAGSQPGRDHAYLSDFGLTKHGEQTAGALTRSGQLIGSVGYVAPEQIENLPIDARVDVYSLGCVVYECLSGAQPFPRDTEMATLYAHVNAPLPSLALARPELPPTIDAVIAKAMAKSPDERYASAGELAKALSAAVRPDDAARHLTRGFLFSDLRDYTAFIERNGDAAAARLLETYRRLVRDVVRRFGGAEIKTEGDSFYVVFPSASDAVRCGVAIVDAAAVASANAPERPIHVGIGVHAGETAETDEGYVGSAVNIAARVCAQAAAGEVLVTDTVRGLTRTSGDIAFTSRGKKHLKGIEEPMAVYAASATVAGVVPMDPGGGRGSGTPIGRRLGRDRDRDRRRPAIVVGLVALVLVGLSGAGFLVSRGQGPGVLAAASPSASSGQVPASVLTRTSERIVWSLQDMTGSTGSPCVIDPFEAPITDARLWMMDPDGSDQVPLLPTSDVFQGQPAWRPDGKSVVFVGVEQDFTQPLWTVAADATATKRLQPSSDAYTAASSDPAWSRDGTRLAFIDAGAIVTMAPDGSGRVEVRQETKPDEPPPGQQPPPLDDFQAPTWMPDGRIAFVRRDGATDTTREGPGALFVVNADGTGYEQLLGLELNTLSVDSAAWSPDGGRIVLAAQKGGADSQIWLVNSDGTGLRQLTTDGASTAPTWSPDGSSIAFSSSRDGHLEIYRMAADGSAQERLTETAATVANCRPTWAEVDPSLTTPAPIASPGPSAGLAVYHRGRLDPGQYRDSTFNPAFTMDLPAGWVGRRNFIDGMAIGREDMARSELDVGKIQTVSPDGCVRSDFVAIGQTARDVVTWLQRHKALKTSNLRPINKAGYSGLQIDVEVGKAPKCEGPPFTKRIYLFGIGQDSFSMATTDKLTFAILDVAGTPVTIIYGGPPEEGFKAAAQPIVDSVTFSP